MARLTLVLSILALLPACKSGCGEAASSGDNEYSVLKVVEVDTTPVEFYIDLGTDSAILGFMVENDAGIKRYFPIYASTYRGLPHVTLEVYLSDTKDLMWVRSSWQGYETLAAHYLGTDSCLTRYGKYSSFDEPTPESLGSGHGVFPEMDESKVTKIATIKHMKAKP